MKLEELQPDAAVRGILPNGTVEVVSVQWHGSEALTLIYRPPSGGNRRGDPLPARRGAPRSRRAGAPLELRRRRLLVSSCIRGSPHSPRPPVRSRPRGAHLPGGAAAAPDHRGVRGHAAAAAVALPARRRPRRRQDDHGRAAYQGADRSRRPRALPGGLSREAWSSNGRTSSTAASVSPSTS